MAVCSPVNYYTGSGIAYESIFSWALHRMCFFTSSLLWCQRPHRCWTERKENKIKQVPGDRKTTAPTKTWLEWLKRGLNTVIRTVATGRWEYNRAAVTWSSGGIHIHYKQGLVLLGAPCPRMPFHDSASLELFRSLASVPLLRRSYPLQNVKNPCANQKWHLCGNPRMFPPKLGPPDPA